MDQHLIPNASPTDAEREAVDALIGAPATLWEGATERSPFEGHVGRGGHHLRDQRQMLLPALQAVQSRVGYLSPGGLNYICQRLGVPPAEAWGVASFYALLALEAQPPVVAHVCDDIACRIRGGLELCEALEREIGPEGTPAHDGRATWHRSPCLGLCERAPAVLLQQAGESAAEIAVAPVEATEMLRALTNRVDFLTARSGGGRFRAAITGAERVRSAASAPGRDASTPRVWTTTAPLAAMRHCVRRWISGRTASSAR